MAASTFDRLTSSTWYEDRYVTTLAHRRADFRALVKSGATILVPGVPNALSARVVEEVGFDAVCLTGAGLANTYLDMPDIP
jgi:2-methylisocitrate lyase-like PEP mutase family enzyme